MKYLEKIVAIVIIAVFISSLVFFVKQRNSKSDNKTNSEKPVATKEFKHAQKALYNAEIEFQKTRNPETNQVLANIRVHELAFALTLPANENLDRNQYWIIR